MYLTCSSMPHGGMTMLFLLIVAVKQYYLLIFSGV